MSALVYPFPHAFEPARYAPAYLRSGILEAQVQERCIARLRARWRAEVTVIDVGDKRFRGRLIRRGVDPRALAGGGGDERGIVDLQVTFPGGLCGWFEVKKPARYVVSPRTGRLILRHPAGAPTREQLDFLARQARIGAVAGLLWSDTDLDSLIPAAEAA